MRKVTLMFALMVLAGCERSSTATGGMIGDGGRGDLVPGGDPPGELADVSPMAVPSVRRVAPGLYAARVRVESGPVTLIVRTTSASGFAELTSGSEVIRFHEDKMAQTQFATTPGYRYLVIAVPGESDPMLLDYNLASYTEVIP